MPYLSLLSIIGLLFLLPISTLAEDLSVYTLKSCLNASLAANPKLQRYKERTTEYKNREEQAHANLLPKVSLSQRAEESSLDGSTAYDLSMSVSQTLYQGRELHEQWQISKKYSQKSELDLESQYHDLILAVKKAWIELLTAQEILNETTQAQERLTTHVSNTKQFFNEGWNWSSDVLEAEIVLARGEQNLVSAQNRLQISTSRLNSLMHRQPDAALEPQGVLAWQDLNLTYDQAVNLALEQRPELRLAKIDLELGESSLVVAKSDFYPTIIATATASRAAETLGLDKSYGEQTILLTANWKIWDWQATEKEVASARSKIRQQNRNLQETKDRVLLEVREAWLNLEMAAARIDILRQVQDKSEENFRVNIIRYQERQGSAADVLDAQDLLTRTRTDTISSLATYLIALAQLDHAVALDLEHEAIQ